MTSRRRASLAACLLAAWAVTSSCVRSKAPAPTVQPESSAAAVEQPPDPKALAEVLPPSSPRSPPPKVTAPMQGEPAAKTLAEAKLVASSCADQERIERDLAAARIQAMRREVDASFRRWAEAQPGCWEQYRWKPPVMRSYRGGAGGLGLSGIGEGGGGRGEGIGLGSIGTIGHGSGSGSGFGSGTGRAAHRPRKAASTSGTNNQVAGVQEADIVKTDGTYVYVVMNGALHVIEALAARRVSKTPLPGHAREMFVQGDRVVVYTSSAPAPKRCTYGYDCIFAGDGTSTVVAVFDVSDRTKPTVVRQLQLSGSLMAARRIGNAVHTVVADGDTPVPDYETWPPGLPMCGTKESVVREKFAELKRDNERKLRGKAQLPTIREGGQERELCDGMLRTRFGDGRSFTTVVSFDVTDDATPATTATVQSRPGAVFASHDALYLSVVNRRGASRGWYSFYGAVDEVSEIHKFRIGERPGETRYVGSGVVPGHVLNQFSLDSWYGYLRIATTRGRVPDPRVSSAVSILAEGENGNLVRVGAVEGIAPGEDIRAVRFDGDRGYVVTFKKTDPLFVIDLYDASRPRILGELKIPGYSTYMQRIDPDHLISIGFDADDHGDFAYFDGIILQLFDVRDPTDPKLIHKETIGTRGSSSEATTNHLAFNYFGERGLLAFPMTICEGGDDGRYGQDLTFSGLLVYDVSVRDGFKRLGGVQHGSRGVNCNNWWTQSSSVVKRSVFLDDLVYSVATDRVKVQRLGMLGKDLADIGLL